MSSEQSKQEALQELGRRISAAEAEARRARLEIDALERRRAELERVEAQGSISLDYFYYAVVSTAKRIAQLDSLSAEVKAAAGAQEFLQQKVSMDGRLRVARRVEDGLLKVRRQLSLAFNEIQAARARLAKASTEVSRLNYERDMLRKAE